MQCGIDGVATVDIVDDELVWSQADPSIHVDESVLKDPDAVEFIEEKYALGEWCPFYVTARHARRKDDS